MPATYLELLYKAVTALAATSLAINAYLIQGKVEEMTSSIKTLNDNVGSMVVNQARLEVRTEILANRADNSNDRLQYLERALKRM